MTATQGTCTDNVISNENFLLLKFDEMLQTPPLKEPYVEIYLHDPEEPYSDFPVFRAFHLTVRRNMHMELLISPRISHFQNKKSAPCSDEEGYSFIRVRALPQE